MKANAQAEQMRERLREFHAQAPEECVSQTLLRAIEDPLKPRNESGRFRLNPILVLLLVMLTVSVGTFLLFSFGV